MGSPEREAAVGRIARALAANSGAQWDRLDYYPGYLRGRWRSEARILLNTLIDRGIPPAP